MGLCNGSGGRSLKRGLAVTRPNSALRLERNSMSDVSVMQLTLGVLIMNKTAALAFAATLSMSSASAFAQANDLLKTESGSAAQQNAQAADTGTAAPDADSSLPAKVMKDSPGVTGDGTTDTPTAKPESGSLSDKAMKDAPGVSGAGTTATPTAKPESGSLSDKAMKDAPGTP
jgi:hypothetical protein